MPLPSVRCLAAAAVFFCASAGATAVDCPRAALAPVRAQDRCDAMELYDDTRNASDASARDWNKVAECARASGDERVLMMLYANGTGVVRNLQLAAVHACRIAAPPAETRARWARLRALATSRSDEFDLCDDAASVATRSLCAAREERRADRQRRERYAVLTAQWTVGERSAFETARLAAYRFARQRADDETDHGNGAGTRLATDALSGELDRFAGDLEQIALGKPVPVLDDALGRLDRALAQSVSRLVEMPANPAGYLGTIRLANLRRTQPAWRAYRDALADLGAVKTSVAADVWKALLTERRLRQLIELENAAAGR